MSWQTVTFGAPYTDGQSAVLQLYGGSRAEGIQQIPYSDCQLLPKTSREA